MLKVQQQIHELRTRRKTSPSSCCNYYNDKTEEFEIIVACSLKIAPKKNINSEESVKMIHVV